MSAIDWLGEKINDPPDFYAFPREKNGKSEESNIEIKVDRKILNLLLSTNMGKNTKKRIYKNAGINSKLRS